MKFLKDREDAVSPVIGVILMVAITVILAAVIAAFVFGMAGSISKTKTVAATASKSADTITVVFNGGPDQRDLAGPQSHSGLCVTVDGTLIGTLPNSTGSQLKKLGTAGARNKVTVAAYWNDGSSNVVLDVDV